MESISSRKYNGKEWICFEPKEDPNTQSDEQGNPDAGISGTVNIGGEDITGENIGTGGTGVLSLPGQEDVGENGPVDEGGSDKTIVEGSEEAGKLDDEADNMQQMGEETKDDPVETEGSVNDGPVE